MLLMRSGCRRIRAGVDTQPEDFNSFGPKREQRYWNQRALPAMPFRLRAFLSQSRMTKATFEQGVACPLGPRLLRRWGLFLRKCLEFKSARPRARTGAAPKLPNAGSSGSVWGNGDLRRNSRHTQAWGTHPRDEAFVGDRQDRIGKP